jgi:hypothetical protein
VGETGDDKRCKRKCLAGPPFVVAEELSRFRHIDFDETVNDMSSRAYRHPIDDKLAFAGKGNDLE